MNKNKITYFDNIAKSITGDCYCVQPLIDLYDGKRKALLTTENG